jgi:WD40 repeat protein
LAATSVRDSKWPAEERANPFLSISVPEPGNVNRWVLSKTYSGHQLAVSGVAHHPKKAIVATVSDDNTWKIWSLPNGDLIMSGEGHKDWISGVAFHPRGTHLATASGDKTVKIWDFVNACCTATFTEHT